MTGQDADIIVSLRDEKNMAWVKIAIETGYGVHNVKNTYRDRKAGKVYLDEALKYLKDNYDFNKITLTESLKVVNDFGVKISWVTWQQFITDQQIPLKGTRLWRDNLMSTLLERVQNGEDFDTTYNEIYGEYYTETSLNKFRPEVKRYFVIFKVIER